MENNYDIPSSLVISVIITSLMTLLLLFISVENLTTQDFMILSVLIGIISAFAALLFVNRYIYKKKTKSDIRTEIIISVIVAYFLFFTLLFFVYPFVDPEIQLSIEAHSTLIGIFSVFASIFVRDKFFQKRRN